MLIDRGLLLFPRNAADGATRGADVPPVNAAEGATPPTTPLPLLVFCAMLPTLSGSSHLIDNREDLLGCHRRLLVVVAESPHSPENAVDIRALLLLL